MSEQEIQQRIRLALSRGDTRLFRNNVGTPWTGETHRVARPVVVRVGPTAQAISVEPGDLVIRKPRPFHAGLCPGSADLVGWRTITITPDMVGQQVAVFTSIEVKAPRGRVSPEQQAWDATVRGAGGLSGIARSIDDARGILDLNQLPQSRRLS